MAGSQKIFRNPYTVGGFVRGRQFYGRSALIEAVFDGSDRTIWIMGNRRSGKTSLLRHLEERGNDDTWVTFHISMEAADTQSELAQYFIDEVERGKDRLDKLGLTVDDFKDKQPHKMIRMLDQHARNHGKTVILLFDEAEALIGMADCEGDGFLKDLRREMERSYSIRVVLAATRRLAALNDICHDWPTSHFLDGVILHYLGALEPDAATALIRQAQLPNPLAVDDAVAAQILDMTDGHPYLTQWLCCQLWSEGGLREPTSDDLTPDGMLSANFQDDYNALAPIEQKILRCLASGATTSAAELLGQLDQAIPEVQLRYLMTTLARLGYVRRAAGGYRIGNPLLGSWLQFCNLDDQRSQVSDQAAIELADEEHQHLIKLITAHRQRLNVLEIQAAQMGATVEPQIATEIDTINLEIAALNTRLSRLRTPR